ncbi:DUF2272 domain-containing protein [Rhizobium terrae]|uniref:DUF2272 domain-containing protein n=1 Tax=Rhizobium terrae TaxID=2171756 RepID=UPI000E3B6952|nr:DUF2272 domain-containing protein [Rhizobium terrae]
MTQFTTDLVNTCKAEYARWDNGAGRETWGRPQHSKDYYLFVKQYWQAIGNNNLDGRTIVRGVRPAWSSAFVCSRVKDAGAGNKFLYTEAHCHYVKKAMDQANGVIGNFGYAARRTDQYKPQVGDIIVAGREYANAYDYDQATLVYEADSFYPSHGDIVIDITSTHAITIGGNITNNVDQKKLRLTDTGYLRDRLNSAQREVPWIAILECLL